MRKFGLMLLMATLVGGAARSALARMQYYKVFEEVYLTDHENKDFSKTARDRKNQCFACHQGKNRKNRNPYGVHVAEVFEKAKNVKDVDKIKAALAKVGEMHSDPKDDKSPTYDELIKDGKFPGGPLEEVQKEPEPPK